MTIQIARVPLSLMIIKPWLDWISMVVLQFCLRKREMGVKENADILLYREILVVQEWYKSEINNIT